MCNFWHYVHPAIAFAKAIAGHVRLVNFSHFPISDGTVYLVEAVEKPCMQWALKEILETVIPEMKIVSTSSFLSIPPAMIIPRNFCCIALIPIILNSL